MRNLALSSDAAFQTAQRWDAGALPINLPWRSSLWRYVVPASWIAGSLAWLWIVSIETPRYGATLYALLFIGLPAFLLGAAAWWITQLRHQRTTATLSITDDYVEWQFEMGSDLDMLTDCSRFTVVGKRDAWIEWNLVAQRDGVGWATRMLRLDWLKSDRTLYARDVGLDRDSLEGLCKLLNQLRDEATARR